MDTVLIIIVILISLLAQLYIINIYNKYKKIKLKKEDTGFDVARTILDKYELNNIYITEVKGTLTDHYFYTRKVVRLSKHIFHGKSIMSTSMAAFLSAHALMDNEKHKMYSLRMKVEPIVNFITLVGIVFIFIGLFFASKEMYQLGIAFEVLYLLFQVISLPIEFDASKRALDELLDQSIIGKKETDYVRKTMIALSFLNIGSIYRSIKEAFLALYRFGSGD